MHKLHLFKLSCISIGLIAAQSSALALTTSQQIQQLKRIVMQQQQQIKQLRQDVLALSKRTGNHAKLIKVITVKPEDQSILATASNPGDRVKLAKHKYIFGTDKANLAIYGNVDLMSLYAHDGKRDQLYFGTNSANENLLNFDTIVHAIPHWKIGSRLRLALQANPSADLGQNNNSITPSIDIQRAEVFVEGDKFGTVYLGDGQAASEDTAFTDLSNTTVIGYAALQDFGGGLLFRNRSDNELSSTSVANVIDPLDGEVRLSRVRYDSPSWHGILISTSAGENGRDDIALKYGDHWGKTEVAAQAAYTSPKTVGNSDTTAHGNVAKGSASILFKSGIALSGAGGILFAKESNRNNPSYFYLKPSYQREIFNIGLTAFAVDFGRYYDFSQNKDRASSIGGGLVQNIDAWDVALYTTYRHFSLKQSANNLYPLNLALFGAYYEF